MQLQQQYDVAIVGGGLAGLSCAIQLNKAGHSVVLFEKEAYPFHKVCGEYISLESRDHLLQLGLALNEMQLPVIDTLILTAPNGSSFTATLPLGGFGISRYKLDHQLAVLAKQNGVTVLEETKVVDISFDEKFTIQYTSRRNDGKAIVARVCCAAFGKRSNLDVKWKRKNLQHPNKKLHNYVAIKYHVKASWKANMIGLHNFKNGYCGISKIEDDKYCVCYMTNAENLKNCGNDIEVLENKIVSQNPHLEKIFSSVQKVAGFPVSISQISFHSKKQMEHHVLMLGDAAGMITPLCGNGMSIALHSAKIAAQLISRYLLGIIDRKEMEKQYVKQWKRHFAKRLQAGRILQQFFGSKQLNNAFVGLFKTFPFLAKPVIKLTHGKPF